ncbi:hypothetical protein FRB90_000518 [Tulasnella sp. 427]|nr:hypothetical protein FRB90_000518 [Tulasnella sp. 427]
MPNVISVLRKQILDKPKVVAELKEKILTMIFFDIKELNLFGSFVLVALKPGNPEALEEALDMFKVDYQNLISVISQASTQEYPPSTRQFVSLNLERPLDGSAQHVDNPRQLLQLARASVKGLKIVSKPEINAQHKAI